MELAGPGTAVPSCVALMSIPSQIPQPKGTMPLPAHPAPQTLVSPGLGAGNTQTLECCSSHFRTSLPSPQCLSGKSYPQIQRQTFNRHLLRRDFRLIPTLCSNSFLSCFLAMLISSHCSVLPIYPSDCKYIYAAALLQPAVTAISGTHTQSFPRCIFSVTNISAIVLVASYSVITLIAIGLP